MLDELCINDSYIATMQNGQNDYMLSTYSVFINYFSFDMPSKLSLIHQKNLMMIGMNMKYAKKTRIKYFLVMYLVLQEGAV